MDLQKLVDAMNKASEEQRSKYQLTLGGMVERLEGFADELIVHYDFDENYYPSSPASYRGYYSDLSFPPSESVMTASNLLSLAKGAIGSEFYGYKGGDFLMHVDTPLWASPYGSANGIAIMDIAQKDGKLVLITKVID